MVWTAAPNIPEDEECLTSEHLALPNRPWYQVEVQKRAPIPSPEMQIVMLPTKQFRPQNEGGQLQ